MTTNPTQHPMPAPSSQVKPSAHLDHLDGWRGLAIALVLEAHFMEFVPLETGRMGVDVFFSLSGFLMSGVLFIKRQPLRTFYKRRISRIAPVFFLFVAVVFATAYSQGLTLTAKEVLSTSLFLRTYFPASPGIWDSHLPIGHLWSLNIEEHAYVLMSLLVLIPVRETFKAMILLGTGIGCILMGYWYVRLGNQAPHWGELGTEVAASHLLISAGYRIVRERWALTAPSWAPILAIVMVPFVYTQSVPWWTASLFSPLLLAFSINHLEQTSDKVKQALSSPPLRLLGVFSFSIYLWQQPFYLARTTFPGGPMAALAAALFVSILSYYLWERPIRAWLNRVW